MILHITVAQRASIYNPKEAECITCCVMLEYACLPLQLIALVIIMLLLRFVMCFSLLVCNIYVKKL